MLTDTTHVFPSFQVHSTEREPDTTEIAARLRAGAVEPTRSHGESVVRGIGETAR